MASVRHRYLDVKHFGADETAADNTVAVQDALNAAASLGESATVVLTGMFDVSDHLYIYGDVSLEADQESHGLRLTASPANGFYWIIAGGKQFGATTANGGVDTWTGRIQNMTFRSSLAANAVIVETYIRTINLMSFEDITIDNVKFKFDEVDSAMGGVGRYNNANFLLGANSTSGATVTNCKFDITPRDETSEAFGFADCSNIQIESNSIRGIGDDPVGLHNVERFTVNDNDIETVDGRILLESCQYGEIHGNTITRTSDAGGNSVSGGGMIHLMNLLTRTTARATSDISIMDNNVFHGENINSATYGIRLMGTRRIDVADNRVERCNSIGYGVTWEGQPMATGWADPEGVEPDNIARTRDIHIRDNTALDAGHMGGLGANIAGPVQTSGNVPTPSNVTANNQPFEINGNELSVDGAGRLLVNGTVVGTQT